MLLLDSFSACLLTAQFFLLEEKNATSSFSRINPSTVTDDAVLYLYLTLYTAPVPFTLYSVDDTGEALWDLCPLRADTHTEEYVFLQLFSQSQQCLAAAEKGLPQREQRERTEYIKGVSQREVKAVKYWICLVGLQALSFVLYRNSWSVSLLQRDTSVSHL